LNAILKLDGNDQIEEVTIANPYQFPRVAGEKASIIDVRAIDKKGRQFVVEMQIADVDGFDKRVQYYTCRDYSMQIDKGEKYPLLKPTYFIGILDFNFFESKSYLSYHIIVNGETYEHKLKDIQFTFVELKKFNLEVDELSSLIEKWVFFIKNAENLNVIPDNVDDEGLREAYKDADRHNWKKEELIAYDNFSIAEQDTKGRLKFVIDQRNKEIVEGCLEENMSIELIERINKLPRAQILQIMEERKNS
jgi:predicted transposase/invertase (TIGR01784 family)